MKGSFEDGEVVIRMSRVDADALATNLMYTIDYREEEHPDYHLLQQALYQGLGEGERA